MAQPKDPPLSIRPGAERLAKIDAYAEASKLTRHAAVLALIDAGLGVPVSPFAADRTFAKEAVRPVTGAEIKALAKGLVPSPEAGPQLMERKRFNPQPKPVKKR